MSYFAVTYPRNAVDVPVSVLGLYNSKEDAKKAIASAATRFGHDSLSIYELNHIYTFQKEELGSIRKASLRAGDSSTSDDPLLQSDILRRAQGTRAKDVAIDAFVVRRPAHR